MNFGDPATVGLAMQLMAKLVMGAALGATIGYERERHGRPAGIRTHMLVVIGTILFCEAGRGFGGADPSRVAAQVVTGIGFLGAGTIIRRGGEVQGLTSAASVWSAAGIGMVLAVGGAYMLVAVGATILVLATLALVRRFEKKLATHHAEREMMVTLYTDQGLPNLLQGLEHEGMELKSVRVISTGVPSEVAVRVANANKQLLTTVATFREVQAVAWHDKLEA